MPVPVVEPAFLLSVLVFLQLELLLDVLGPVPFAGLAFLLSVRFVLNYSSTVYIMAMVVTSPCRVVINKS